MARTITKVCDICGKETPKIVGKLHFIPMLPGKHCAHSNYTHHADVGVCCEVRLMKGFKFRPRQTAAEYRESRKAGS